MGFVENADLIARVEDAGYDKDTIDWERLNKDWSLYLSLRPVSLTVEQAWGTFVGTVGGIGGYVQPAEESAQQ